MMASTFAKYEGVHVIIYVWSAASQLSRHYMYFRYYRLLLDHLIRTRSVLISWFWSNITWMRCSRLWMRCSRVVRASDFQCRSRNSPGFDPSILRHSEIWGATDEAVLNTVHRIESSKNPPVRYYCYKELVTISEPRRGNQMILTKLLLTMNRSLFTRCAGRDQVKYNPIAVTRSLFRDGILGQNFNKNLEFFTPCYSQSRLLAGFNENHTLFWF